MHAAAEYAAKGVRDPEVMQKACEDMDRLREKNAKLYDSQEVCVDIVREMRDSR